MCADITTIQTWSQDGWENLVYLPTVRYLCWRSSCNTVYVTVRWWANCHWEESTRSSRGKVKESHARGWNQVRYQHRNSHNDVTLSCTDTGEENNEIHQLRTTVLLLCSTTIKEKSGHYKGEFICQRDKSDTVTLTFSSDPQKITTLQL